MCAVTGKIIITQYPAYTGVGKYVQQLSEIDPETSRVYSLKFKNDLGGKPFFGEVFQGRFQIPFLSGWFFNSTFQRYAFPKYVKEMKRKTRIGNYIFHYSDFGLKPFTPKENSVLTLHDFFLVSPKYKKYNYKAQPLLKENIKKYLKFENVIADTKHVAAEASECGFEHEPVVAYPYAGKSIFPGLDKKECRNYFNLPHDEKLVLSISSNDPRKNNKAVKETFELLDSNYKLVKVGSPIEGAFNFNNLTEVDINRLYNACDVFLFPTLDEGLGFPLIEAMTAGIPVVASDIEAVREICSGAAILVEPTPIELSKAILSAIENSGEYINKGISRSSRYSPENFHKSVKSVYSRISE